MKRLFLGMFLLCSCAKEVLFKKNFEYAIELSQFEKSREKGLEWVNQSAEAGSWELVELSQLRVIGVNLAAAKIYKVNNPDGSPCRSTTGDLFAFVLNPNTDTEIYICPAMASKDENYVAQALIHESIHLIGILDECQTTAMEIEILKNAGQIPEPNGYFASCGFEVK